MKIKNNMKKIKELDALGKTKVKALKQAKRWFKKNPNRKRIYLRTTNETIFLERKDVL